MALTQDGHLQVLEIIEVILLLTGHHLDQALDQIQAEVLDLPLQEAVVIHLEALDHEVLHQEVEKEINHILYSKIQTT